MSEPIIKDEGPPAGAASLAPTTPARPSAARMRALRTPTPARVLTDDEGFPVELLRRGKRFRVIAVRERWRIDDEWWRHPISREYYALVLEDGRPVILYKDLLDGGWFSQ